MISKNARLNPGRPGNLPLIAEGFEHTFNGMFEQWNLYDRGHKQGFDRWKLSAAPGTSVTGKANYALSVKDGTLFTKDDGSHLREDRPELFEQVRAFAAAPSDAVPPAESVAGTDADDDPFGDVAESNNQPLTQSQQMNRALLNMRGTEIHWLSRPDKDNLPEGVVKGDWDQGVKQAWYGIYKGDMHAALAGHKKIIASKAKQAGGNAKAYSQVVRGTIDHLTADMPQDQLDDYITFITDRDEEHEINYEEYLEVQRQFYAGNFGQRRHEKLAEWYDYLTGLRIERPAEPTAASAAEFEAEPAAEEEPEAENPDDYADLA